MADHNQLGVHGENIAKKYLIRHGYEILESNWRFQRSEIDIIGIKNDIIIFFEVKTRSSDSYGSPESFVSQQKMDFLLEAASQYMIHIGYEGEIRFDIIGIITTGYKGHKLKHLEDAFFNNW